MKLLFTGSEIRISQPENVLPVLSLFSKYVETRKAIRICQIRPENFNLLGRLQEELPSVLKSYIPQSSNPRRLQEARGQQM